MRTEGLRRSAREVRSASAAAAAAADNLEECQPNQGAPLLRDEGARRAWVEQEIAACCTVSGRMKPIGAWKSSRDDCHVQNVKDVTATFRKVKPHRLAGAGDRCLLHGSPIHLAGTMCVVTGDCCWRLGRKLLDVLVFKKSHKTETKVHKSLPAV